MGRVWIATLLNFFFPGAGYLVLGEKRVRALGWLAGAGGLTYVELGIQTAAPGYYWPMFIAVFVMNTAFAVDVFRLGKSRLSGTPA